MFKLNAFDVLAFFYIALMVHWYVNIETGSYITFYTYLIIANFYTGLSILIKMIKKQ